MTPLSDSDVTSPRALAGMRALVTGGSRGIGAALAFSLAQAGADVAVAGRDMAALAVAAARVRRNGTRVAMVTGDLRTPETCGRVVADAAGQLGGGLDLLVNAAGSTSRGPALDVGERGWHDVLAANLDATFFTGQAVARLMVAHGRGGAIINIASLNSVVGNGWAAAYAASKGAVASLTRSLALEWADAGIRVNAIGPGMIATEMTAPLRQDEVRYRALLGHIPMHRFGRPDELGGAAVFLASPAASYITGQILYIDGGYLAV